MQTELVTKDRSVILEAGEVITDVVVQGGKIVAIGQDLPEERMVDATGLVTNPGMVNAHVHIIDPGGGYRDGREGYITRMAACAKRSVATSVEVPLN